MFVLQVYWNRGSFSLPAYHDSGVVISSTIQSPLEGLVTCDLVINSNFSVLPSANSEEEVYDLNTRSTFMIMATGIISATSGKPLYVHI